MIEVNLWKVYKEVTIQNEKVVVSLPLPEKIESV